MFFFERITAKTFKRIEKLTRLLTAEDRGLAMKNIVKRYDIIITILLFLLIIPAEYSEWFSFVENQTLSIRHILRQTYGDQESVNFPADKIAIVFQDEAFFDEYGSFPIRRVDIGKLVYILKKMGAKVIMVDLLMDFPSSYNEDPVIADYLKRSGNTILVSQLVFEDGLDKKFEKINYPTKIIHEATQTAYSNHIRSGDMLNRLRLYPDIINEHNEWPISVKTVANYLGVEPEISDNLLTIGKLKIKLDQFNDFRNDFFVFKTDEKIRFLSQDPNIGIPALDILELDPEDEDDLEEYKYLIEGKIVFLGDTWEVSHDLFPTIVGEVYGVEQLAQEVATLLKGAPLRSASLTAEIALSLIFLVFLILLHFIEIPVVRYLAAVLLVVVYFLFCSYAYIGLDLVFSMSYTLIAGLLGFMLINVYLFIQENEQRNFIKGAFGQYLSPAVIEALVENPDKLSLGGERREMTAYFSDVQGFSTISESLTPDELVALLNEYLTEMCNIIASYNGTVDKFEGDAIIAFWGAPLDQPDHAKLACYATIDMQKRMVEMRKQLLKENRPLLLVRMGINSGPMVVGNMGSQTRMDYTIMGDAVNLAARLEGANKFYKNFTMISGSTYKQVEEFIDVRELDTIRVVGKNEPVTVYEALDRKNQVTGKFADMIDLFHKGLSLYKELKFAEAIPVFKQALALYPQDGPSLTYVDRCDRFLKNPMDDDWDRVYTHTEKG